MTNKDTASQSQAVPSELASRLLGHAKLLRDYYGRVNTSGLLEEAAKAISHSAATGKVPEDAGLYEIALKAIETLRGYAATIIEDHSKDSYSGRLGERPQDVAAFWAREIHSIDAKTFLDEAIADASPAAPLAVAVPAEEASDVQRDAARYRVLRLNVWPGQVNIQMTKMPPPNQKPEERIDFLCDLVLECEGTPAEPAPIQSSALTDELEQIAKSWDGSMVDAADGKKMDVAETLRAQFRHLARLSKPTAQRAASRPNTDCSGDPSNCPDNEGYGCACSQSPAQVTGEPASIDTEEFRQLLLQYTYEQNDEMGNFNDEWHARAALIAHINCHIAAQAPAGRDAVLEEAARVCEARIVKGDSEHHAPYNAEDMACADAIRLLKSHAAEQTEGRAK